MKLDSTKSALMILVPALNEEGAIAGVIHEIQRHVPGAPILIVDDCSTDATRSVAERSGAVVISVPAHLGLGGCVQAGYKLAFESGFSYVIRVDGDGQHNPADIPRLYDALLKSGVEMVIGSRYTSGNNDYTSWTRRMGIEIFRLLLWPILGQSVRDPTSGFVGVNHRALAVFARSFRSNTRKSKRWLCCSASASGFLEVPCEMRSRQSGRSSITPMKSVYYLTHVLLGVFINVLKFDGRRRA